MKKLIIIAAVMCAAYANAARLDWKYQGTKSQLNYTVYMILGSTAQSTWETQAAVAAAALGSGKIAKSGTTYFYQATANSSSITSTSASYYYVLVDAAGENYQVSSVIDGTEYVYDPDAKESSPGAQTTKSAAADWSESQPFDVPEPTSALLMLIGVAGLALRRRA